LTQLFIRKKMLVGLYFCWHDMQAIVKNVVFDKRWGLFDYKVNGMTGEFSQGQRTVWSQVPLQPLTPGPLTPFSYSVLAEIVHKAWFRRYDQLGFEPSRAKIVSQYQGRPYFNITQPAQLEAQHAGVEPLALRVNGARYPLCSWEKPGLMAGMRAGRARKRLHAQVGAFLADIDAITARTRAWYEKTVELNWSQAELLQVMEEIERISLDALSAFLVARHQLQWTYNRLIWMLMDSTSFPQSLNLINGATCDVEGLLESKMAADLLRMAEEIAHDDDALDWVRARAHSAAPTRSAPASVTDALTAFLEAYGHRTAGEGEMANVRWNEDPAPLLHALLAMIERHPQRPTRLPSNGFMRRIQDAAGRQSKEASTLVESLRTALILQSKAMNAVAFVLAGTRNWALAAGEEAMSDGRLLAADDAFLFELEEMKQMMTGEWNVSAREDIQSTAARRRLDYAALPRTALPATLFDDTEGICDYMGLPGSTGQAVGPLRRWQGFEPQAANGAIVGAEQVDSGWSILMPVVDGVITACGVPFDPVVAAARHWHTPMMVSLGQQYVDLVEGAQTTLDVEQALVDQ